MTTPIAIEAKASTINLKMIMKGVLASKPKD